jgi:hypothetical protein
MAAGSQTDTLIGGGVALATIGGVLMGVGASENSGSGRNIWSNPWFATGVGDHVIPQGFDQVIPQVLAVFLF